MRQFFNLVSVIRAREGAQAVSKQQYDYCYTYSKIKALSRHTLEKPLVGARETGEGSRREDLKKDTLPDVSLEN